MEIFDKLWSEIDRAPTPSVSELQALNLAVPTESPGLFESGHVTELYIRIQTLYRYLFSMFLTARSGLDHLDGRLAERGYLAADGADMDFYQKYDLLGLKYLYLRSFIHIERLTPGQLEIFCRCLNTRDSEAALRDAVRTVDETYRLVLAVDPARPDQKFQLFPSVGGEGRVSGRAILIGLKSREDYDSHGNLRNRAADRKRVQVFLSVKGQVEPILSKALETETTVIAEV